MATNGKWEARITIPTGGWDLAVSELGSGGSGTATVAAGTYYHSTADSGANDLSATLQSALNAGPGTLAGTYTVSIAAGENGTGKVTISVTGGGVTGISLTWTDTELRNLLGFSGSESDGAGVTSITGDDQAEAIWFPSCPPMVMNGYDSAWGGWWVTNNQEVKNPHGNVYGATGRDHRENTVAYDAITRAKTWAVDESSVNESFETFMRDGIHGTAPWGTCTGPVRWYPDAGTDGTSQHYSALGFTTWRPEPTQLHFVGNWRIVFPELVEVPT